MAELPEFLRLCLRHTRSLHKSKARFVARTNPQWDFSYIGHLWRDIPDSTTGAYMEIAGVTVVTWCGNHEANISDHTDDDTAYHAVFVKGALDLPILVDFVRRPLFP